MLSVPRCATLALLLVSFCAQGQQARTVQDFQTRGWEKSENGLIISWQRQSGDAEAGQISLSDTEGHPITSLKLLHLVPDAGAAWVYDVSARPGGIIAVAAVYVSKEDIHIVRPESALLLFDFGGHLLSFFSLAPSRSVQLLEIDEESNIWTLTAVADEYEDPAHYPMVVEYTPKGGVKKELLPRSLFPFHASAIQGNGRIGFAHMGYDSGGLWFWLPGTADLVTIPRGDQPLMLKTGLPTADPAEIPTRIVRDNSGSLVGEFSEMYRAVYYTWSPSTKKWTRFSPGTCDGDSLIGSDAKEQVYLRQRPPAAPEICVFRTRHN